MIGYLSGTIQRIGKDHLILETGGVGYKLFCSPDLLAAQKEDTGLSLFVHTAVGESHLHLYGFQEPQELTFFELLIGISGIGPKSALGIIAIAPVDTLMNAIAARDTSYLTKVSGIGKKSAEKIVLELKDKLGTVDAGAAGHRAEDSDALDALTALGYTQADARNAIKQVPETKGTQAKIREALKILGS